MPAQRCPQVFFENVNDKSLFLQNYVDWKKSQFKNKSIFDADSVTTSAHPVGGYHHQLLRSPEIITDIFRRLDRPDKRSMSEVCKLWASWFLVGTQTRKADADYTKELNLENNGGIVVVRRQRTLVQKYCLCMHFGTEEERNAYHDLTTESDSDDEQHNPYFDDKSGSEGYYDSDC